MADVDGSRYLRDAEARTTAVRRQLAKLRDRQAEDLADDLARVLNRIKQAQLDASYQDGLELTHAGDDDEMSYFGLSWAVDGTTRNLDVVWDTTSSSWVVQRYQR